MSKSMNALRITLGSFSYLTDDEWSYLGSTQGRIRRIEVGKEFISESLPSQKAYILHSGWVYTYRLLSDGSRQVINFHIPGDFIALSRVILRYWGGGAIALTDIEVSEIAPETVVKIFESCPKLATAILWAVSRESAISEEHLIDLGRRTALIRTAHFLLELSARLKLVGMGSETGYDCPISQSLLADAVGISSIHLNRVLRQLRERGYLTFRHGRVTIDNPQRLIRLAQYDGSYLDQHSGPALL